jgi:cytidylate kinase
MTSSGGQVDQRLLLLRHHWGHHPVSGPRTKAPYQEKSNSMTIAISREAGSRGTEIANKLGQQLDWPVYDREVIDEIAKRTRLRTELLDTIDQQTPHWLVESLVSFGRPGRISGSGYAYHLPRVLAALSEHGECIIVGRGAAVLLPPEKTVRVRVVATLEDRTAHMSRLLDLPEKKTKEKVLQIDRKRAEFIQSHFHKDDTDAHTFDLVLNSSRLATDECAAIILQVLKSREALFGQPAGALVR